uniref:Uncharacterized protein n=1 Tax=Anguilla anguilla TaxID=7936 RepID=A0A0E9WF39_ANGAN
MTSIGTNHVQYESVFLKLHGEGFTGISSLQNKESLELRSFF